MTYGVYPMDNNKSGIYVIRNSIDDRVYIGSAVNIRQRFKTHERSLQLGSHSNKHLQRFYNKYGLGVLNFQIIEVCPQDYLIQLEQLYIDSYDFNKDLFNIAPTAGSTLGTTRSMDTINKVQKASINGIRKATYKKNSTWVHKAIKLLDGTRSAAEVASILGKTKYSISHLLSGASHKWLVSVLCNEFNLEIPTTVTDVAKAQKKNHIRNSTLRGRPQIKYKGI